MKMSITNEAAPYLAAKLADNNSFILALNDGSNQFSSAQGCCMIGDRFLIKPIKEKIVPFIIQLQNDHYSIYTSNYEKNFLPTNIILDRNKSYGSFVLRSDEGILDMNVTFQPAE
ncbi:hypothetical protein EsVE80_07930 [Enterococcus saigonensis]|uniref:Core domain-containing protein n=1 Tax=Enterococcus saigonensis TaxID=1805431 RepID=A0A679IA63_9ENTE|nr:iron-sulfur cluster biosynthesis family protein [Enterococcus saigonensis]BCA85270.1 hypothetical protein EsVE80_07930 [Enterococcus saigonensis]